MWIPNVVWQTVNLQRDVVISYLAEIAALRAERDTLRQSVDRLAITQDWMRVRLNSLEMERSALLSKVAGVDLPVPELTRRPEPPEFQSALFEDAGDDGKYNYTPVHAS